MGWTIVNDNQPLATYYEKVSMEELLAKRPKRVVLDPYDGPDNSEWRSNDLNILSSKGIEPIAYISLGTIGEWTEEYLKARELGILGPKDPQWPGSNAVEFWNPKYRWFLKRRISELASLGFNGICVDVIDVFTREWYVKWYESTVGSWESLYRRTWKVLKEISSKAIRTGLSVYTVSGAATTDVKLTWLAKVYSIVPIFEELIANEKGELTSDDYFYYVISLMRKYGKVVVFEYFKEELVHDPRVSSRLDELFDKVKGLMEVYLAVPEHDTIRPAVVRTGK